MRKSFKLDEIDCANCALKLEDAIKKVDGVDDAKVNFMTQKLTLAAADDRFPMNRQELDALLDVHKFTGCAEGQTEDFLRQYVRPVLERYQDLMGVEVSINV